MYKITTRQGVEPEDILQKALNSYKEREAKKQIRDPYLRSLHQEVNKIYKVVIEAMMKEVFDLLYEDKIEKSIKPERPKGNLVKVQVVVNGKHGQYKAHRWKSPEHIKNMRVILEKRVDIANERMYDELFHKSSGNKLYRNGKRDKEYIEKRIKSGKIDLKSFYKRYKIFKKNFQDGINTPAGKVFDKEDRYFHIIKGHQKDMFKPGQINNIVRTLKEPDKIYRTKDKNGVYGNSYLKTDKNKETLLVVVRNNNIATSYIAKEYYLKKILSKGEKIYEN